MSSAAIDPGLHGYVLSSRADSGVYEPSIASSAPSSQDSVFSDTGSAQSSIASSISDDFRSQGEVCQAYAQTYVQQQAKAGHAVAAEQLRLQFVLNDQSAHAAPSYADVTSVPSGHRQHPRRSSLARHQKPPPLVRQCERKVDFVDNLVDSATQMVEVIWPLSVVPCQSEGGSGRAVLPLRTYIEETLRRSRTSYSTLQVALYYLILIKPFVPKADFTMEQTSECPASRALLCGRRMFLAALILASKYLQDRNYSAKAWSKMSGLRVCEINENERTFLGKVDWRLHIPQPLFQRWQAVVLRYTPSTMPPPPPDQSFPITWKRIVEDYLTADLGKVPMPQLTQPTPPTQCARSYSHTSPATPTHAMSALSPMHVDSTSQQSTPTPSSVLPRFLEPKTELLAPPTPALARMGPLPTPQMTPTSIASSTPAVSAYGSRRPSICSAMAMAQKASLNRCTMDAYSGVLPNTDRCQSLRRPSFSTTYSGSSPESMISSRSSRASSISSVSTVSMTSSLAPHRACLARQATCRNVGRLATLPATVREEEAAPKPIKIVEDAEPTYSSPDFTVSEKALHAPHRHSKHAPHHQPVAAPPTQKGQKRARPRGGRRTGLQEEVRLMLEEEFDAMEVDIDEDSDVASPSAAAECATRMLSRSNSVIKQAQPTPSLVRRESARIPVQKLEGKKRTCCTAPALSVSPSPLY